MLEFILVPRDESWLEIGEVAVPLEITVSENNATVEYYPSAEAIVTKLIERFGESVEVLFSDEAISFAVNAFGEFLESYGFSLSPDSEDFYINCKLKCVCGECHPMVRKLTGSEEYNDLTDTDIDGLIGDGYIIYAAVVGNDIVAVANTGEPITEETPREVEIGVDTAEKHRRCGYGRACISALVNELTRLGHTAIYEYASKNTASARLVKGLGGEETSRKFYIVGFME
ncbi:MAG: GNAT family N-acetyltransferase [Clostridia bacterium]|nr:GNAT family N-acetyltransferase [Clostridia bacterium]